MRGLVHDLIPRCLKLVVLEIQYFLKREGLFGVTIGLEGIEDFRKLCLANNSVLQLTHRFVSENYVALVHAELERQEQQRNIYCLVLANLDDFQLARVWVWYKLSNLLLGLFSIICLTFGRLSTASSLSFLFGSLSRLLIFFIGDLYSENDILRERIVQFDVNLAGLVELGRLVDCIDGVTLINVRD